MNFLSPPGPLPKQWYEDAIELYARRVSLRARAVYQVGSVAFPGISDLDLLVVVEKEASDNSQYFSALLRLPKRFHRLFLHEPFILPASMVNVLQYTSHGRRRLIGGRDELAAVEPLLTVTERWSKLLESYQNFQIFLGQCNARAQVSGRLVVAVASSLRYALADLDAVSGTDHASSYAAAIDELRLQLFHERVDAQLIVERIWVCFVAELSLLKDRLSSALSISVQEVSKFVDDFLIGKRVPDGVSAAEFNARNQSIDRYFTELYHLRFSFGYLFFLAAHPGIRRYKQPRALRYLLQLPYTLERVTTR